MLRKTAYRRAGRTPMRGELRCRLSPSRRASSTSKGPSWCTGGLPVVERSYGGIGQPSLHDGVEGAVIARLGWARWKVPGWRPPRRRTRPTAEKKHGRQPVGRERGSEKLRLRKRLSIDRQARDPRSERVSKEAPVPEGACMPIIMSAPAGGVTHPGTAPRGIPIQGAPAGRGFG